MDDFETGAYYDFLNQYAPDFETEAFNAFQNQYRNPYEDILRGFPSNPAGNLEQDYYVTDKGGVITSSGEQYRPPFTKDASTNWLSKFVNAGKGLLGKAGDFAQTPAGIMTLLSALASMRRRPQPHGGGTPMTYAGYKPLTRTIEQGKYGPIARYAAQGGIMQAYAHGGATHPFPMQDGGFVMTKRAVDGAGGFDGMRAQVPEAMPIRGPGHGTSDSIPAYIQGQRGRTPAAVSNGEMYVPPGRDTRGLYALMKALERRA